MCSSGTTLVNLIFSTNHIGAQKELDVKWYVDAPSRCRCLKGNNSLQDSSNSHDYEWSKTNSKIKQHHDSYLWQRYNHLFMYWTPYWFWWLLIRWVRMNPLLWWPMSPTGYWIGIGEVARDKTWPTSSRSTWKADAGFGWRVICTITCATQAFPGATLSWSICL